MPKRAAQIDKKLYDTWPIPLNMPGLYVILETNLEFTGQTHWPGLDRKGGDLTNGEPI